jgi:hypothetical protein
VHASIEEKSDLTDSFYEELEQFLDHFSKYHKKILLGDFNAQGGERIFSIPTILNEVYIGIVIIIVLE